jgi:antirestriction protein ArdC
MSNIYEVITDRIIATLESGVIPWRKEWKASGGGSLPYNLASKKPYRGVNILSLLCSGYGSNGWCTYKQAQSLGYQVRKGEKSSPVVFWKYPDKKAAAVVEGGKDSFPFARFYSVFNIEQLDGVPAALPFEVEPFDAIEDAEKIVSGYMLSASHPTLGHGGDRAYFRPSSDHVQMPEKTAFTSPAGYYATLFHEFAHSTGIKSRCNRAELIGSDGFGGEEYSKEELTAEFSAAFLCAESGIANDQLLTNSAAYIQAWVKKLKNDKTMVVQASQRAQRAADYILQRVAAAASDDAVAVA